ncbi:MAG: penicillin-insensitive murein endopeptidase [Proteobacteria bacterium]|nr:penicillin-insensitive murein endopeptidase [Pseudomonadota bacterium]
MALNIYFGNNSTNRLLLSLVTACALIPIGVRAEQPAGNGIRDSISVGTPMKGSLQKGEVLPRRGDGYVLTSETKRRRARFGVAELIALIKDAAFRVHRKHRGSALKVADLSTRLGGRINHHGSHQNGRDVDFIFYLIDEQGRAKSSEDFVSIDANGHSIDPPLKYRFDTARNWALVEALLRSDKAVVQWIFVADHIKKLLVAHAKQIGASPLIIGKARQVLSQPGKKTHIDHFHVRIYCPQSDRPECRDIGPTWAWTR